MTRCLDKPDYYINRELSALAFNQRVLSKSLDDRIPLLERLRYLFIADANMDEFFEIRIAGVKRKIKHNRKDLSLDGLTPQNLFLKISETAHQISADLYDTYHNILLPLLEKENIFILTQKHWNAKVTEWVATYFKTEVFPIVSPIGLDLARPFPRLVNKSLNFIISLRGQDAFGRHIKYAVVHAPRSLPRTIRIPDRLSGNTYSFVYLSSIIQAHVHDLFPGMKIDGCYSFRLTRNSDLFLNEDEIDDLVNALKTELFARNYGDVVKLEVDRSCPPSIVDTLSQEHNLDPNDIYLCDGPVNLNRHIEILDEIERADLEYQRFTPIKPLSLQHERNLFEVVSKKDILLHHPYESFQTIVNLIYQAAHDPNVLAIKQTLYRTHSESAMVNALVEAARLGKEVTAVIELRARFDEESNIALAAKLNEAGVLVLYGIVGFKTHTKMTLVIRREENKIKSYVHLGTGNYHERTARLYTDVGLLTSRKSLVHDIQNIFHHLTGIGKEVDTKRVQHAPFTLQKHIMDLIQKTMKAAKKKEKAFLFFKVNGLTDKNVIKALYKASQAGVEIKLFVRTLCCLRPGIKGISENITVTSIVGRFLEHHRIYYAKIGDKEHLYCASADLMERNLYNRVETLFPILDPDCFDKIKSEIIQNYLKDDKDAWVLQKDGSYQQAKAGKHSAQEDLLKMYETLSAKAMAPIPTP